MQDLSLQHPAHVSGIGSLKSTYGLQGKIYNGLYKPLFSKHLLAGQNIIILVHEVKAA